MKLRLTNAELRAAAEALRDLSDREFPVGLAFQVVRLTRQLQGPVDDLRTTEMKIVDRYMEKDEDSQPVPGTDEHGTPQPGTVRITDMEAFQEQMRMLLGTTVEPEVSPVERAELEGAEVRISARTLLSLGDLLRA